MLKKTMESDFVLTLEKIHSSKQYNFSVIIIIF